MENPLKIGAFATIQYCPEAVSKRLSVKSLLNDIEQGSLLILA